MAKKKGRAVPEHKKHQAFPGYIPSTEVRIENGTIKPIKKKGES